MWHGRRGCCRARAPAEQQSARRPTLPSFVLLVVFVAHDDAHDGPFGAHDGVATALSQALIAQSDLKCSPQRAPACRPSACFLYQQPELLLPRMHGQAPSAHVWQE